MSDAETRINPYAPVASDSMGVVVGPKIDEKEEKDQLQTKTLRQTAVRWFMICSIGAAPSFFYGMAASNGQFAAMLVGIAIFVVGYTWLDYRTADRPFRKKRTVRRTLKIAYGTRIAISLLFPVALYLDLICGLVSMSITQWATGFTFDPGSSGMTFWGALLTTLVQGVVLNVVLGVYALLVHGIQLLIHTLRS